MQSTGRSSMEYKEEVNMIAHCVDCKDTTVTLIVIKTFHTDTHSHQDNFICLPCLSTRLRELNGG